MELEDYYYEETEAPEQADEDIDEGGGIIEILLRLLRIFAK